MAHIQKYNRGAMGHILSHYDRSKDNLGDDIDKERTELNYNLAVNQPLKQLDFVHKRLTEVKIQNRKDVNIFCDWVVTAPKDLPGEEHKLFFQETYNFFAKKYGPENVISAYVHMDETMPHIHFAFIPVVPDPRRGGYKISAKEAITRTDLQKMHPALQEHLEHKLGHEVSILNGATKDGNKSIIELKRETAIQNVEKAQEARKELDMVNIQLMTAKAEYEAKKAYVSEADKISNVSMMYPDEAKVIEKGLVHKQKFVTVPAELWEAKHISVNEKNYLKGMNEKLEEQIKAIRDSDPLRQIEDLTKKLDVAEGKIKNLRENLARANKETALLKKVFEKNPDLKVAVLTAINQAKQQDQMPQPRFESYTKTPHKSIEWER